ncbi:protein-Npi-phosphohistidine-sugar phosphotransferase [Acididesulfobacillus acetoxydans]|uniref:BglG transcriptional antiterminator n=1 Tax=Acididesulfobacillus acetoxydans TaxID=1561005 RepID=A0A8S0W5C6_9FIRM|nr:BglG family transcription antiterminator [Acididesulfobacillus acetoxydans]CAA7603018.1 protein-Npi-phosphohistidine-sugar phosphotransferase [Acididesulfobacillus acetoxydans]CEJ08614.1 BglG transcriptional antiterminator [Acididesulfobacillus acetoxydans]
MAVLINLDSRSRSILSCLVFTQTYLSVGEVAEMMNISKRSVYYELGKINDWFSYHHIPEVQVERQKGICLSELQRQMVQKLVDDLPQVSDYIYSPEERVAIIICFIMAARKAVFTDDLGIVEGVSRSTVTNDLKIVRAQLGHYGLELEYEHRTGYLITGSILKKWAVFLHYLHFIIDLVRRDVVNIFVRDEVRSNLSSLSEVESTLKTEYVEGTLLALAVLISVMKRTDERPEVLNRNEKRFTDKWEFKMIQEHFPELGLTEQVYLTVHLLGARVQSVRNVPEGEGKINSIIQDMIAEFEHLACVSLGSVEELKKKLLWHIHNSIYRYDYGIIDRNPLTDEIESKYPYLFRLAGKVAAKFYRIIGCPMSRDEIAYLTMYFGAHLVNPYEKRGLVRALLVCPNGVSTAGILTKQVQELSSLIEVLDVVSVKALANHKEGADLIISTVPVEHSSCAVIVHPVLTKADKQTILSYVYENGSGGWQRGNMEEISRIVEQYVPEEKRAQLHMELKNYENRQQFFVREVFKRPVHHLNDILTQDMVQTTETLKDWQAAISLAAEPLVRAAVITPGYVQSMIAGVESHGPYIFITPNIALAHAKPENGVLALGVSFLIIKQGVLFEKGHVARVIIALAPVDNEKHLGIIRDIVEFFANDDDSQKFMNADSVREAYTIIRDRQDTGAKA